MDQIETRLLVMATGMGQRAKLPEQAHKRPGQRWEPEFHARVPHSFEPPGHEYVEPESAIDEIPLEDDIGRALVRVQAPAAIAERLDVMDMIVVHNRAGLHAERVNPAHIRRHALTDGVYVVEADVIVMRVTTAVTPSPADRDAG